MHTVSYSNGYFIAVNRFTAINIVPNAATMPIARLMNMANTGTKPVRLDAKNDDHTPSYGKKIKNSVNIR